IVEPEEIGGRFPLGVGRVDESDDRLCADAGNGEIVRCGRNFDRTQVSLRRRVEPVAEEDALIGVECPGKLRAARIEVDAQRWDRKLTRLNSSTTTDLRM